MQSDSMRWRNLSQEKNTSSSLLVATWTQLLLLLFDLESSSRHCGVAYHAEILGAASGAEMAGIEQMKKNVPLITCEIPFSQHVCELVFGVNVTDLNVWVQIYPVNQPIQSNSVGP